MEDVFLSYAHEDRSSAELVADGLRKEGFGVFFDPQLQLGGPYDAQIEKKLDAARAVIVLWSPHSCESEWVRSEASRARDRDAIVPVVIEACRLPVGLDLRQAANLTFWAGDRAHPEWGRVIDALVRLRARRSTPRRGPRAVNAAENQLSLSLAPTDEAAAQDPWGYLGTEAKKLALRDVAEIEEFRRGARAGEMHAQFILGLAHIFGMGVPMNVDEGIGLLRSADERGWSGAAFALAVCCERGILSGGTRAALVLYQKAARRHHAIAGLCAERLGASQRKKS